MFYNTKRKFYSIFKKDLKDERGSVAIIFAIILTVMFGVVDTVAEHTRITELEKKLQKIADETSKIALLTYVKTQDKDQAIEAINAYMAEQRTIMEGKNKGTLTSHSASVTVQEVKITFKGRPQVSVHVHCEVPRRVLTLLQKPRYVEKRSTSAIANANTEIAVVLDISGTMRDKDRMQKAKRALTGFSELIFGTLKSKVNKIALSLVPFAGSVHLGEDYRHFVSSGRPNSLKDWGGCPSYWSPASRGWTDEVSNAVKAGRESVSLTPMANLKTGNQDPWCPKKNNRILTFAQTSKKFTQAVDDLTFGDGTSTDMGMAWGFRTLSEFWKGIFVGESSDTFPLQYTNNGINQKHLILLTDGVINVYHSNYKGFQAEANFRKTCENIGARGITMHIIGYDVTDSRVRELLEQCAMNSAKNGGQFYEASPSTLNTVFENILAKVTPIKTAR